MVNINDTIVAVATAKGESAISIIRMSGSESLKFVQQVCKNKEFVTQLEPRKMYLSRIEINNVVDDVLVVYFKEPSTFTGEELVEIHCHGNHFLASRIVEGFIKMGARAAEAGEFTARAFMNGKMDLTKAEGIFGIINAKSEEEIKSAYDYMSGTLYRKLESLQKSLIETIAKGEVCIDYPEEDIEEATKDKIIGALKPIIEQLEQLEQSYDSGRIKSNGVSVALVGEPNVGKSMLLNALLEYDRAIVTSEAGTTRDTIEESYLYKGMRFNFIDTAGIRETKNVVEKIGIEKSYDIISSSDIIIAMTQVGKKFSLNFDDNKKVIYVINKADEKNAKFINKNCDDNTLYISAKHSQNIDKLKQKIYNIAYSSIGNFDTSISNLRHLKAVKSATQYIKTAIKEMKEFSVDLALPSLSQAYRALGTVTGVIATDAIVEEIFSKFCVGK